MSFSSDWLQNRYTWSQISQQSIHWTIKPKYHTCTQPFIFQYKKSELLYQRVRARSSKVTASQSVLLNQGPIQVGVDHHFSYMNMKGLLKSKSSLKFSYHQTSIAMEEEVMRWICKWSHQLVAYTKKSATKFIGLNQVSLLSRNYDLQTIIL